MENDKKTPYSNFGFEKSEAIKKKGKGEPTVSKITGKGDLRVGGRK